MNRVAVTGMGIIDTLGASPTECFDSMLDTYDSYPSWRKFQPYFPENWRINEQNAPEEYYWKWRDFDVHIDHYKTINKPNNILILILLSSHLSTHQILKYKYK